GCSPALSVWRSVRPSLRSCSQYSAAPAADEAGAAEGAVMTGVGSAGGAAGEALAEGGAAAGAATAAEAPQGEGGWGRAREAVGRSAGRAAGSRPGSAVRVLRPLCASGWARRRVLAGATVEEVEREIAESGRTHGGAICFAVEANLSAADLL